MEQETWNILFSWLTGKQCFVPEGCNPPFIGIVFYLGTILLTGLITFLGLSHEAKIKEMIPVWR